MSDSFVAPWTVACQAPLSMRFPRQEYWGRLSSPSPGDLPNPGIERTSPALAGGFFTPEPRRKPTHGLTLVSRWRLPGEIAEKDTEAAPELLGR